MLIGILAILCGLLLLFWSANKFVENSAFAAGYFSVPPLLVGMLIIGFGTSAPELVVSITASIENNSALVLGNVLGSNIANIALILGVTSLIAPITVQSTLIRKELPLLIGFTLIFGLLLSDNSLSRINAIIMITMFVLLVGWSIYSANRQPNDPLQVELKVELPPSGLGLTFFWLVIGLLLLVGSSKLLVWGAIHVAQIMQVNELIIGLTIVGVGTSLPEFASSVVAARKGQHDLAIGNVIGSNMFNLLAVTGVAGVISPISRIPDGVLIRDWTLAFGLSVLLALMGLGFKGKPGRINRLEGAVLLTTYILYTIGLTLGFI